MDGIYEANDNFPFQRLHLLTPTQIVGGNYFIKFRVNEKPLYIQPPKCKTKGGIIKAGKKMYNDLMFTNENENFIRWMENLESHCQKHIYENRQKWFETELDNHDIENSFVSPLKTYKSGKYYIVRSNIPCILGKCSLKIYDEYENEVDHESIEDNSDIMCILEIQGIKCSARSFQIEIEIKQMLTLKPSNLFEKCLLKPSPSISKTTEEIIVEKKENDLEIVVDTLGKTELLQEIPDSKNQKEQQENTLVEDKEREEMEEQKYLDKKDDEIYEVEFNLEEIEPSETVTLKNRNDVYYKMYKDAKRKAKEARDLALSSFLEAKRIKNTYMLNEIDSDSDLEEDNFDLEEK
jgi:hypothetical protein